jgi:7-cyano-7-deazaguanine synthase
MSRKIIAIASGGLDSTTMVYDLLNRGHEVDVVSFNYGQRHSKELNYIQATTDKLGLDWDLVDLRDLTPLLAVGGSSLVSDTPVPEGHYAEDNMTATIVPNRNMMMLSFAGGIAVARGAQSVATAVHAGDHYIYPDCRPHFMQLVAATLQTGNEGVNAFDAETIVVPYINSTKTDIAMRALELGVPLDETWSCYKGGEIHCGKCGTCVERLEAIHDAVCALNPGADLDQIEWPDKTQYEDSTYWTQVVL